MVWEEVRGESRREPGPSIHHLKGAQPQGLSGQGPYSEENSWQKFSPTQMYFEGYLVSVSVIIPFILSAFPEDGGRYGTWNSQGICKTWTSCWLTLDVNFGPLSDCRDEGRPNLGIVSVRRIWATVWALLSVVGNVSTHPEKVSTWTRRYLTLQTGGIWVKSICRSRAGRLPRI